MTKKTVLLIDDEQGFLEALADALESDGCRILKATTAEEALRILKSQRVDLVTVDIMLPPGPTLETITNSHSTGLFLCREIRQKYPAIDVFCISVVSEHSVIRKVRALGVRFLSKGEVSLRTVLNMIRSRLTGTAYSTERDRRKERKPINLWKTR